MCRQSRTFCPGLTAGGLQPVDECPEAVDHLGGVGVGDGLADEAGDFFVEEAEGFGVAGTGVFLAEQADFFGKDKPFPQAFEADAGGSGVNQVAVAAYPGAEAGILQGICCPAVVCPAEGAAEAGGKAVNGDAGGFGRSGDHEGVGADGAAVAVNGSDFAFSASAFEDRGGNGVVEHEAEVVHAGFGFRIVVGGTGDFEGRVGGMEHVHGVAGFLHAAFVQGDVGAVEPAFCLEVGGKVPEEGQPVGIVFRGADGGFQVTDGVAPLVEIVKGKRPGHDGVAVDLAVDAEGHHEFHPTVKDGVVISPGPVDAFHFEHHAFEGVFGLPVPRVLHDGGGNHLLPGIGKPLHEGAHEVEVGFAPEGHVVVSGDGVGVLPEVEVELPLGGGRQLAGADPDFVGEGLA